MGGGGVRAGRAPSHVAYYVALAGVLALLLLLCCYFLYFFVKKVLELSAISPTPSITRAPQPAPPPAYAVRPEVRVSAHAMAQLCEQLPPTAPPMCSTGSWGNTVYPSSCSASSAPPTVPLKHPIVTDTGPPPAYKDIAEMSLPAYVETR